MLAKGLWAENQAYQPRATLWKPKPVLVPDYTVNRSRPDKVLSCKNKTRKATATMPCKLGLLIKKNDDKTQTEGFFDRRISVRGSRALSCVSEPLIMKLATRLRLIFSQPWWSVDAGPAFPAMRSWLVVQSSALPVTFAHGLSPNGFPFHREPGFMVPYHFGPWPCYQR